MGFFKEFKQFAMRGNVVDMAVGIVIGAAFGKIVSSLVNDVIMPPLGMLLGGINFTDFKIVIKDAVPASVDAVGNAVPEVAAVALNYGNFIQVVVDFLIVALAIFLVIKGMNQLKKKEEEKPAPPPAPNKEETLLAEIRDLLKK
ncbi:MAG: large-conductance mechanosensitive channel protein MscL [Bacteroidales bacterium]|nr:large-conductance mechanosensitive channel protein MscL [Bacteroidales bacterium]